MRIVWDEPKRANNLVRHGLDFADVEGAFDWAGALYRPTYSGRSGKSRTLATGHLGTRLVALVFSPLGSEAISLISLRPAGRSERRRYAQS